MMGIIKRVPLPSVDILKQGLRYILKSEGKIVNKADWVKLSKDIPVYNISKPLTRFLLFVSTHDTVPDLMNPGLVKSAKKGSLEMLTFQKWNDDFTIEHIAPRTDRGNNWHESLYENTDLIHCLGNLTLLPQIENSSFGDRSWEAKRFMYGILATKDEQELSHLLFKAKQTGLDWSDKTQEILLNARYLPHVEAISKVKTEWMAELVQKRSKSLAGLVWNQLSSWLDLS